MNNQEVRFQLSPPWETYVKKLKGMFTCDPEIKIMYDREMRVVHVYVDQANKADALTVLLKDKVEFGEESLTIEVIPANKKIYRDTENIWEEAFYCNDVFCRTEEVEYPFGKMTYVMWTGKPIQFFNDDLSDFYGNETILPEDIAADIFKPISGTCHCTVLINSIDPLRGLLRH